ncbi:cysteine desulfurase, partial [candidate division WOR-3 bacterium]
MIYLDYNATTPTDPEVIEAMLPYFNERFANSSSIHRPDQEARQASQAVRGKI